MAKSKAKKAGATALAVKDNPYIHKLVEDDDLRENLWVAYESAKDAYERLASGKNPASKLLDDKKVQKDLRQAAESLRDASHALRDKKSAKAGGGLGKLVMLALVGGIAAVALSEGLRNKVLDMLFGAEEEFEYTSPTTSSSPPASTPAPAQT